MFKAEPFDEAWIRHLAETYSLEPGLIRRLGEEFLAATEETWEGFVAAAHLRYRALGLRNDEIYGRLREEVAVRRFRVDRPTERQIRRIIYG